MSFRVIHMKTILQYFAAFILMLGIILQSYAVNARPLADRPAPEFDYVQEVGEGKFLFVMLSIEDDPTGYGQGGSVRVEDIRRQYPQSGLYRHDGSVNPIWTVDWYAFQVALSSDGQYLVRWGPWPFHENYNELAVAFYKNGREIKQYTVRDLVAEPELLPQSVSHYEWEKEMSFDATTNVLHLETHNGEKYDFDVTTGKNLVDKESSPTNVALIAVIGILLFCGASCY